jgi:hypothetical protein
MKSTIDMIEEAGLFVARENPRYYGASLDSLKAFEALVRADAIADERNSWPAEMEAMKRQVNILTDALAAEREQFFTPEEARVALEDTDFTWHQVVTQEMVEKLETIRARGETK